VRAGEPLSALSISKYPHETFERRLRQRAERGGILWSLVSCKSPFAVTTVILSGYVYSSSLKFHDICNSLKLDCHKTATNRRRDETLAAHSFLESDSQRPIMPSKLTGNELVIRHDCRATSWCVNRSLDCGWIAAPNQVRFAKHVCLRPDSHRSRCRLDQPLKPISPHLPRRPRPQRRHDGRVRKPSPNCRCAGRQATVKP
jgi:hypothetical protein